MNEDYADIDMWDRANTAGYILETQWMAWRAAQFDSKANRDLVDEVFAPIVNRWYALESYYALPEYGMMHYV